MSDAVYPGSFDPVTRGHVDIIARGLQIFPQVTVAVIDNPNKKGHFTLAERVELLRQATAHLGLGNLTFDSFSGLLVDYLKRRGSTVVLRGLRHSQDLEGEFQMARLNQAMFPKMDSLFLAARPENIHISSTFVREIAKLGGDISFLVPPAIHAQIIEKYRGKAETQ
jgi:pantetheine-phosphate adenylyltransferase